MPNLEKFVRFKPVFINPADRVPVQAPPEGNIVQELQNAIGKLNAECAQISAFIKG